MTISAAFCGTEDLLLESLETTVIVLMPNYCGTWQCNNWDCRVHKVTAIIEVEVWKPQFLGWVDSKVWFDKMRKQAARKNADTRIVYTRDRPDERFVASNIDISPRDKLLEQMEVNAAILNFRDLLLTSNVIQVSPKITKPARWRRKTSGDRARLQTVLVQSGYRPKNSSATIFEPEDEEEAVKALINLEALL